MAIGDKVLEGRIDFPHEGGREASRKWTAVVDYDGAEASSLPEKGWPRSVKLAILLVGVVGLWGMIGFGLYIFTR